MNKQHEIEEVRRHHNLFFGDNPVRIVVDEEGQPWWVVKDVCEVLEHSQATKAVAGLDNDEVKKVHLANAAGHLREMIAVSESGLYTLLIRSNKPQAKPFRRWVTSEVIPAIRRTGCYVHPAAAEQVAGPAQAGLLVSLAENTSRMFDLMAKTLERLDERLEHLEQAPARKALPAGAQAAPRPAPSVEQAGEFVRQACRQGVAAAVSKERLYRYYCDWCNAHTAPAYSASTFFKAIYRAVPQARPARLGSGGRRTMVIGLAISPSARQLSLVGLEA